MSEARKTIEQLNEQWMAAFNSGDAAGVAALYTENARMMPPDDAAHNGRKGVQAVCQGAMDAGIKKCRLETVEFEEYGDVAVEIGKATLTIQTDGGNESTEIMKYVIVWKNENGDWRLHLDIWNSTAPIQ